MLKDSLHRYRQLLPALLLTACCLVTIATALAGSVVLGGTTYSFALGAEHYGALAATVITVATFFLARKYYKYFLLLAILLGVVNLVNYNVSAYHVGLTFGDLSIGLNPIILTIGITTYLLNYQRANNLFFELIKHSTEKVHQRRQEEITAFKERFSRKSPEELAQIVVDNELVPAALIAARQLLASRQ